MKRKNRRPLAALLLALAVVATATLGSAATLTVNAASISAFTVTHPCPGSLAATTPTTAGTVSTVSVDPPDACAGLMINVNVNDGAVVRQGTAIAPATGSVTVTLDGAYTPSQTGVTVVALVNGWHLQTTWSYTPPAPPASAIVVGNIYTVLTVGSWFNSGPLICVPVTAFITGGTRTWQVDVNTALAPFDGAAPVFTGQDAAKVQAIGSPGGWQAVGGIPPFDRLQQIHDDPLVFNICG